MSFANISVCGAGTWGIALGVLLNQNGHYVKVWDLNKDLLKTIENEKKHPILGELKVDWERFKPVYELEDLLQQPDIVITVVPAQAYRNFLPKVNECLKGQLPFFINCSKGIDTNNLNLISQIFKSTLNDFDSNKYATLSGPSHAEEVFNNMPTCVVLATESNQANWLRDLFRNAWFRVYTQKDVIGVELAGAIKNVIAIASGISHGIGYGVNTRAALITRGNAEITRLGISLGGQLQTFQGLAGIGDLVVTGMSDLSRNFSLGKLIGQGFDLETAKEKIGMVVEGVSTVQSAMALCEKMEISMPIVEKVHNILFQGEDPKSAVKGLMTRDPKEEKPF